MIVKSKSGVIIVERHHFAGKFLAFLQAHAEYDNNGVFVLNEVDAKTFKAMIMKHKILCKELFLQSYAKIADWEVDNTTGKVKGEYYDEENNVLYRTKWFSYQRLDGYNDELYANCMFKLC